MAPLKDQLPVYVAFFGGIYQLVHMSEKGFNLFSITWVIIGAGYIVHKYKESTFKDRLYKARYNSEVSIDKI
jgi:hypothetical protein